MPQIIIQQIDTEKYFPNGLFKTEVPGKPQYLNIYKPRDFFNIFGKIAQN